MTVKGWTYFFNLTTEGFAKPRCVSGCFLTFQVNVFVRETLGAKRHARWLEFFPEQKYAFRLG